jgi:spore germination cell wall hydrolase CwlJ-like protein
MLSDPNDKYSLRLVAWKEARGDGAAACNLVMHVCLNRVGKPGFGRTLHDVIYGKNQFTSMSVPTDAEFNLVPPADDPVWVVTEYLVNNIEGDDDGTQGALYYQNPKTATSGWFARNIGGPDGKGINGHAVLLVYQHHTFYS